jgi:DNA-binding transcriptional LysR family regulator
MDFLQLEYFRAVARLENMSQAAKELYISQSGLSRYITRLEEYIGVPLFERRKGCIILNTYGQLFLNNVNNAFESLEYGIDSVRRTYSKDQNILSIACSIEDYLTDMLKEFSVEYPEVGLQQYSYSISEIELHLLRQNLDMAICAWQPHNEKIKYEILSQCPYILICNNQNPLSTQKEISLIDAKDERFVCDNSRLNRSQLETLCQECGFTPIISHEIESGYIMQNLLDSNVGVALIPLAQFMKIIIQTPGHELHAIHIKDKLPMAGIGIAYLPERFLSSSAILFMDFLRKHTILESADIDTLENKLFANK